MTIRTEKPQPEKRPSEINEISQKERGGKHTLQFLDNRPEATTQRKLQEIANNSSQVKHIAQLQEIASNNSAQNQHPIQKKENNTGLPDNLKSGVENLSGYSMDDVKVHYNSGKPAQLQAHAYAQGSDIHLGPGQEKHLPHEAWHVVQQKQGIVRPTLQMKSEVAINDDAGLETEADVMGAKALQFDSSTSLQLKRIPVSGNNQVLQRVIYVKKADIVSCRDDERLRSGETKVERTDYQKYLFKELFKDKAKSIAPTVEGTAAESSSEDPNRIDLTSKLIYRGMSANNVANRDDVNKPSVFTVQNPDGGASEVNHIVNDDPDSPYLSFEANGLGISAGKYAHKPVDKDNQSLGVSTDENGFLKQEKSYTQDNIGDKYAGKKRIGVVAGIFKKSAHLDLSTAENAKRVLNPDDSKNKDKVKAVDLAVADKEILVKPGPNGIVKGDVPFYAKVETITEQEFIDNLDNQTPTMALGYHKPSYYKIQIDTTKSKATFHFQFKLDDKYQNGGGTIATIPDLKINKGLFSLSTEEQDKVRDEMPKKHIALRAINSELDTQLDLIANQPPPDVANLKEVVGPDLHNGLQEIAIWFEDFETSKIPKVDELKNFNTLLETVKGKSTDFWNKILTLAELPQIETTLTPIETFLKDSIGKGVVEDKDALKITAKEHLTQYNSQLKNFNKIKSPKNSNVPQIADVKNRFDATMVLFRKLNELLNK
ncbi:MAG: hypothetical protein K0S23_285 [Fluviicola sp.]|jgi:hypothetical protein|uniref:eCIS core domain-containing protein n=1 Tax=Fluviicola sp. TaxID=1917219 RepID=UPI0026293AAF|nr:DUF4157 domain-containing protein [Fluviicola sp.]MDF3025978.1 hypothetical protein [Fluviicola sp.]